MIPALTGIAVLSLILSTWVIVQFARAQSDRERDRIESDVSACTRGNVLRRQVMAIGEADQHMVEGVLDVVLPAGRTERIDEIREQLQPILDEHADLVDDIELTDCDRAIPGAQTTTEDP